MVHRRPRVAVLATGDEVVPAGGAGPGRHPGRERAGARGARRRGRRRVPDPRHRQGRLEDVDSRLCAALAGGSTRSSCRGGVSVGPYDVVKLAFEKVGRIDVWRVAVQPGKPFAFGTAERPDGGRALLFGLPGNPVSSFVTFELFVRPAIRALAGHRRTACSGPSTAACSRSRSKSPGRRGFLRVIAVRDADGRRRATTAAACGSASRAGRRGRGATCSRRSPRPTRWRWCRRRTMRLDAGAAVELWWLDAG